MKIIPVCLGVVCAAGAIMVRDAPPPRRQECHYNSRNQLVCRHCWVERGKYRCGMPKIEGRSVWAFSIF